MTSRQTRAQSTRILNSSRKRQGQMVYYRKEKRSGCDSMPVCWLDWWVGFLLCDSHFTYNSQYMYNNTRPPRSSCKEQNDMSVRFPARTQWETKYVERHACLNKPDKKGKKSNKQVVYACYVVCLVVRLGLYLYCVTRHIIILFAEKYLAWKVDVTAALQAQVQQWAYSLDFSEYTVFYKR